MITDDMKLKEQRNDKSSTKIVEIPNATVDRNNKNSKVIETVKKNI